MCNHISGDNSVDYYVPTDIYAYLGFTVLISDVGQMQVGYAHPTIGGEVSISAEVTPNSVSISFTPSFALHYETFLSTPRTLHIT